MAWETWLEDVTSAANRLGPVLLNVGVRSLVLLALAGVGAAALRRASAAARHWVWMLGFAGLLLLPIIAAVAPGWRVLPGIGARPEAATTWRIVEGPATPSAAAPEGAGGAIDSTVVPGAPDAVVSGAGSAEVARSTGIPAPMTPLATGETPTEKASGDAKAAAVRETTGPRPQRGGVSWMGWLALIWLAGTLVVMGYIGLGYVSLWWLQRRCQLLQRGEWREQLEQLGRAMKVRRPVGLLVSPLRAMPMTWGVWRTRLLLPAQSAAWTAAQRQAVLLHELGHVRRWDCLTQLLAQFSGALYWCNPLVWVAWRRMQVEREVACDDLVLETGATASAYAQHLVQSAAALPRWRFAGAAGLAMARPSTLEERVRAILDGRRKRGALCRRHALAALGVLGAALVPVAVLQGRVASEARPGAPGSTEFVGMAATPVAMPTTPAASTTEVDERKEDASCALVATIYDVRVPVAEIGRMDVGKLTQVSGSVADFEKALAALGTTHPLYHADQAVRLSGDTITISTQTPYVTNSQVAPNGQPLNAVAYRQTGAVFNIAGRTGAKGELEVDLGIQMSTLSAGGVAISDRVTAPTFRAVTLNYRGAAEARRPFVMLSGDGAAVDNDGKAVVYIARVILNVEDSGRGPARGL